MLHTAFTSLNFDLTLSAYARVDLLLIHPHTLDLLYNAGFRSFFFGIETFNEKSARAIGKGYSPDKIKHGLDLIKTKYPDLLISAGMIYGLPYETKDTIKNTMEYLKNSPIDNVTVSPLSLNSDSPIGQNPEKYGYTYNNYNDWSNEFMNYTDALNFTNDTNIFLKQKNKISWLFMNRILNCGLTLNDCHNTVLTQTNKQKIKNLAEIRRKNYFEQLMKLE